MEPLPLSLKRPYPFATNAELRLHEDSIGHTLPDEHPIDVVLPDEPRCLLGSIVGVNAQLRKQADGYFARPPLYSGGESSSVVFSVSLVGDFFELRDEERAFARLEKSFCSKVRRLMILGVDFRAVVEPSHWKTFIQGYSYWTTNTKATFAVDVVLYSPRNHADKVGDILLRSDMLLQYPTHHFAGEDYYNPQILEVDGFEETLDEVTSEPDDSTPLPVAILDSTRQSRSTLSKDTPDQVEVILNSLSHTNILHEIRTDANRIKSELMRHQMTALDFIARRESGNPPAELSLWREKRVNGVKGFHHVLTKRRAPESREAVGGILADDMGLGKSLTILSAIARSLGEAANFASSEEENAIRSSSGRTASRATLIIVPSTVLVDNWVHEIHSHTYPHKVTFHKHLGANRHTEVQSLLEKDVVFTTFATSLKDFVSGQSPLAKVHWFRIVLDEAHKIRNRTTKQFLAVHQLWAQRRWCLTGTPVQNRLEDLGSLVAFLRVPDLENASLFRKHIIAPASPERGSHFQNLQTLLKSICLRRTREIIGLLEPIAQHREVEFSLEERRQYNAMYDRYKTHVQMAVSGVLGKIVSTTLQSVLELRLFCNNGSKLSQNRPGDSNEETLSYLQQLEQNELECSNCSQLITCIDQAGDKESGILIPSCNHLVCRSCLPLCVNKKKACSLCASGKSPPEFANHIRTDVSVSALDEPDFRFPSKLLALLAEIQKEPLQKCIVFSSWKKTLDLAAELFKRNGLRYDVVHGTLSLKQRLKVLKEFRSYFGPNILLMTLGTGAEGLNLTVASRIHLLEPNWNPFVELQAMARAQRIGQTKQVICIRYLMRESIEQSDVLNRQKRKTALAGGGFKKPKMYESLQYFGVDAGSFGDDALAN